MDAILLKPKDSQELKLITDLLDKMKVPSKVLTEEEMEDAGLAVMMKEVDRAKTISKESLFKKFD